MHKYAGLALVALCGLLLCVGAARWLDGRIEAQRQAAAERALLDLLPPGSYDNHPLRRPIALAAGGLLDNREARPAYLATLGGRSVAVVLPVAAQGYEGRIELRVAIDRDARLVGARVLAQRETAGLADLERQGAWLRDFLGRTSADDWRLRAEGGRVDQIAGATLTSKAVSQALQRALRFFDAHRERLLAGETP
ncbi:RnfABCDGE type electron transport complex subunit G [Pseudomonas sp. RIT-PI-AD]|uniref:RnfABCDGE type electron transport complex subunit G n=1 Tax=Pseudomonas sp. RIT-PI-AD TaxID=3035294 RepID=UPI0021D95954|nr:RnfABCDGE type electron transport complex subunit G [Pseudomonas sp. RIT-PI-AD]